MAPEEVAARKVLALFDRAEARDFVDVFTLSRTFDRSQLLDRATDIDLGFDRGMFIGRLRSHGRFADSEFPGFDGEMVTEMRAFFRDWAEELDPH